MRSVKVFLHHARISSARTRYVRRYTVHFTSLFPSALAAKFACSQHALCHRETSTDRFAERRMHRVIGTRRVRNVSGCRMLTSSSRKRSVSASSLACRRTATSRMSRRLSVTCGFSAASGLTRTAGRARVSSPSAMRTRRNPRRIRTCSASTALSATLSGRGRTPVVLPRGASRRVARRAARRASRARRRRTRLGSTRARSGRTRRLLPTRTRTKPAVGEPVSHRMGICIPGGTPFWCHVRNTHIPLF